MGYVDNEAAMTCTAMVWSGQINDAESIVMVDERDLDRR